MKKIFLLSLFSLFFCCSQSKADLVVKVKVKGLKKGTIYLKKAKDSTIINVDSVQISGEGTVELNSKLDSPEIFYLQLNKNSNQDDYITFFADKGEVAINTTLKEFTIDAKITGSKQQDVLEDYLKLMSRINDRHLELIKDDLEAKRDNDSLRLEANRETFNSLLKTKYLQSVNFALQHKDSGVAPYLALTEIADAQIKWLDTINNSLTPEVKASKYGKELEVFIRERKSTDLNQIKD